MKSKKNLPLSSNPISTNKPSDSQAQSEIGALKNENLKLQRQIFKLKAEHVSLRNKIIILEDNTNERCIHETPPYECIQKRVEQTKERIQRLEKELKEKR